VRTVRAVAGHRLRFVHEVLPYSSEDELLEAAVPFLRDGLRGGDRAMVVTGVTNLRLLQRALGPAAAAVEFVDALDWYTFPARTLAAYDRHINEQAEPGRRIRVLGEPPWAGRSALETTEWKRYESVINVALAPSAAWVVCLYDTRSLDPSIVVDALRTHPRARARGGSRPSPGYVEPALFSAACDAGSLPEPPPSAIAVEFAASDLSAVRRLVAEQAISAGLEPARTHEVVLAVHEVASNAVVHGSGKGELRVWAAGRELLCQVSGSDPVKAPFPGHLAPRLDTERGRGLWLARQLCELLELRVTLGRSLIRLHFLLPG
jgi:anti-sigma regulatory factor (Ser/Thr protein kinase)